MPKLNWITILLICFISYAATVGSISAQNMIEWQPYSSGMDSAKNNNKAIFLHFYAKWCGYCAKMEKESFQDDSIAEYLNENFISIRVDVDKEQNIAEKYGLFALPTTYFFSSSGEKLGSVPGYLSKDRLMTILKKI
jgi:thioredoxin 1